MHENTQLTVAWTIQTYNCHGYSPRIGATDQWHHQKHRLFLFWSHAPQQFVLFTSILIFISQTWCHLVARWVPHTKASCCPRTSKRVRKVVQSPSLFLSKERIFLRILHRRLVEQKLDQQFSSLSQHPFQDRLVILLTILAWNS